MISPGNKLSKQLIGSMPQRLFSKLSLNHPIEEGRLKCQWKAATVGDDAPM